MSTESAPPSGVSGKWIVIVLVPAILITFAWLAYTRVNFVHPSSLASRPTTAQTSGPMK